jgi:glycosyltransferase involved in cell wall biosynthesis
MTLQHPDLRPACGTPAMSDIPPNLSSFQYDALPVLHLFHQFQSMGGVESVLRLHREFDPAIAIQSETIIYNDAENRSAERLHCLGIQPTDSLAQLGAKLRRVAASYPDRLAIYHLAWAFSCFCPNDLARRRILVIHTETPGMKRFLRKNAHFLDGILSVNQQIRSSVLDALPSFPADRVGVIGCPINPPDEPRPAEAFSDPVRLAFIGRLVIEQKRIDRIPDFCSELERLGLHYNFDLLGDGAARPDLEKKIGSHKIFFQGALQSDAYWQHLRELDCAVYFSDFEGTPLAMLEALSQGVIPVYPRINSGGDKYVAEISPDLLYPPGDLQAAAAIVQKLSRSKPEEIARLRERSRAAVVEHSVASYLKHTFDFGKKVWDSPRISKSQAPLSVRLLRFLTLTQWDNIRKLTATQTR